LAASTITSTKSDFVVLATGFWAWVTLLKIENSKKDDKKDFIDMGIAIVVVWGKKIIQEKMPGIHHS
jgi:hypothetical protein